MAREKEVMGELNMIMVNTINITYHTIIKMPAYREDKNMENMGMGDLNMDMMTISNNF